ncbi:MAG: glycosyltransferase family 9 protein [Candidatus Brocadiales bacterium]
MGYPSLTKIAVGRHYADKAVRFDHPEVAYLFLRDTPLPEGISRYLSGFDMIVSFLRDAVFTENLKRLSRGHVLPHHPLPQANGHIHIVDHLLSALGGWQDVTPGERISRVFLTGEDRQWASDFLDRHLINSESPVVALHPGSGGRKKCWPIENFTALALHLRNELDAQLFLVSGPADEESTSHFLNHVGAQHAVPLHNLPLPGLAAVLERCHLFVGNDSGVTHLAAATGATTLALFGPTDPAVWGPRGESVSVIQGKVACSPCSPEERGHCQRARCMEIIHLREVIKTAERILKTACPLLQRV